MKNVLVYPILGLTRKARMRALSRRMTMMANSLHTAGVDSRIPFLKKALLNDNKIPDGPTARRDLPIPDYNEAEVIPADTIYRDIARFNIFNASENGLVAFPFEDESGTFWKVLPCQCTWLGDLRTYFNMDFSAALGTTVGEGVYFTNFHQVFVKGPAERDPISLLAHELEHAIHMNLSYLGVFPEDIHPPKWCAEYLALLAEHKLYYTVDLANILFMRNSTRVQNIELTQRGIQKLLPHFVASAYFIARLRLRYGMSMAEIGQAIDASHACDGTMESIEQHPNFPQLKKMYGFAKQEFERMYLHLYGLSLADIKEVVYNLPMI